ncbi:MAG: HAMP domain-containing histidine kinase [Lachnospiraceae bacterium]|nr:HAMP domain-containing histidine kinase [Lachnospiraceae bacterium]
MKNEKKYTLLGKCMAVLGIVLSILCLPASVAGVYYMVEEGFYITDAQSRKDTYLQEYLGDLGREVLYTFHRYGEAEADKVLAGCSVDAVILNGNDSWNEAKYGKEIEWTHTYVFQEFRARGSFIVQMIVPREKGYPDYIAVVCFLTEHLNLFKVLLPLLVVLSLLVGIVSVAYFRKALAESKKAKKQGANLYIPTDLLVVLLGAAIWGVFQIPLPGSQDIFSVSGYIRFVAIAIIAIFGGLALYSHACEEGVVKRSILYALWHRFEKVFAFFGEILHKIPLIWKTAIIVLGLTLAELLAWIYVKGKIPTNYSLYRMLICLFAAWIITRVVLIPFLFYRLQQMFLLKKAGEELARGNSDYKVDVEGLHGDIRRHAENLNRISEGVATAVNERMKSEHLKTELITNVSHDIKTPLTSIINYSDLICKEETDNEKIKEYSEVLYRQAGRLKKLLEDLMEAAKASTGNVEVSLQTCDIGVLLEQAVGEFEQRLSEKQLTPVVKKPEEEIQIMADSRLLWRVFDNLLTNICKYSQSGTRVYLTVERKENKVHIFFKNISEYALDISEEELMERFVRGDRSRHTEGNGLGLGIAKSLVELQGGTLEISVDGDLFKVLVTLSLQEDNK